jgi:hypothetical protein
MDRPVEALAQGLVNAALIGEVALAGIKCQKIQIS